MFLKVLKWIFIGLITSYLLATNTPTSTLKSLSENPPEFYSPEFYPNGTFLQLPAGTMHYWMFGNKKGSRVVLVHGISTGSSCYDKLARELVIYKSTSKETKF
jgi:hypothetical protein